MTNENATVAFVNKIQEMTRDADEVKFFNIDGHKYHDSRFDLARVKDFAPAFVKVQTLSGLTDIIEGERERYPQKLFVIVNDHLNVNVLTTLLDDLERDMPYAASTNPPGIRFGDYYDIESFIITLRSKFVQTDEVDELVKLVMSVTSSEGITVSDDGITQKVAAQKGISMKEHVNTRPIVKLRPYRTFTEVAQPESAFLFRLSDKNGTISAALYEADGGAWKREAMENIKEHLISKFVDVEGVKVIA